MKEDLVYILAKDGLRLAVHHWSQVDPEYVLIIVHGLGEHQERYANLASHLADQRIAVLGADSRGHGLSEGRRGDTPGFEHLLSDAEETLKYARSEYTDSKIILFGHSLGGNIVANFIRLKNTSELTGFILSSPFFEVAFEPPKWKVKLANLLSGLLPGLTLSSELDTEAISRIPAEVALYQNDPLVHDRISIRMYLAAIRHGQLAQKFHIPDKLLGLVYHGDADKLVSFEASVRFVELNQSPKLNWIPWKGGFHESHHDLHEAETFDAITNFLKAL